RDMDVLLRAVDAKNDFLLYPCRTPATQEVVKQCIIFSFPARPGTSALAQVTEVKMAVTDINKSEIVSQFQRAQGDTGSPEVQVTLLTAWINEMTDHFKSHKKNHHSRCELLRMVRRRRKLLDYLK